VAFGAHVNAPAHAAVAAPANANDLEAVFLLLG
jgi:hypothetical protein